MTDTNALVLVVDDNEMNRDMLSRRLQRQQCEVLVAEDGLVALEMVKQHAFDLVLLDIMMPNLSGYDVLERLKTDPTTQDLPVIMISAVDDLESVVRCIEMGAEDYLFKPFNPVLLKARVGACLSRRQLQKRSARNPKARQIAEQAQSRLAHVLDNGTLDNNTRAALAEVQAQLTSLMGMLG